MQTLLHCYFNHLCLNFTVSVSLSVTDDDRQMSDNTVDVVMQPRTDLAKVKLPTEFTNSPASAIHDNNDPPNNTVDVVEQLSSDQPSVELLSLSVDSRPSTTMKDCKLMYPSVCRSIDQLKAWQRSEERLYRVCDV